MREDKLKEALDEWLLKADRDPATEEDYRDFITVMSKCQPSVSDREKFEKWATGQGYSVEREGGGYVDWHLNPAWQAVKALSSRDSTPTEGVGKRVVEEWLAEVDSNPSIDFDDLAALADRIDRVAPRMTLDLRKLAKDTPRGNVLHGPSILTAIREQLPNVDIITEES